MRKFSETKIKPLTGFEKVQIESLQRLNRFRVTNGNRLYRFNKTLHPTELLEKLDTFIWNKVNFLIRKEMLVLADNNIRLSTLVVDSNILNMVKSLPFIKEQRGKLYHKVIKANMSEINVDINNDSLESIALKMSIDNVTKSFAITQMHYSKVIVCIWRNQDDIICFTTKNGYDFNIPEQVFSVQDFKKHPEWVEYTLYSQYL